MKNNLRHEKIIALVNEQGFLTVNELSRFCDVSEMTIRRDLEKLDAQERILRTYGGATQLRHANSVDENTTASQEKSMKALLLDEVDVVIASSVDPYFDNLLVNKASKKDIPIIAESIETPNMRTIVAVDNYQAGFDLGCWAGKYLEQQGIETVNLLDLTFHKSNTQARSRGFVDGLNQTNLPNETILSIDSQSRYTTAYQIAQDALSVYPQINLIFAINDITAWGAINACRDLNIDPSQITVITFGLEGETLINELMMANSYCKAGLAMFPEIVSLACIEEAIAAYNQQPQPKKITTPHVILSAENLHNYYTRTEAGWVLNWEMARDHLNLPLQIQQEKSRSTTHMPKKIGLIVPFIEHEWYKNLTIFIQKYAKQYGIELQVIDAEQSVRDEVDQCRRQIAHKAASLVESGNVLLIDGGPIALYLAEELKQKKGITVITNSVEVFNMLNCALGIILISTGGAVRYSTQMLVGPTAEGALKELRADKLFLTISGITLDFGLSHHTISEVTIKQAMIHSAKEVIVMADHTAFETDVGIQVAPLKVVHRLITDDSLEPNSRLEILKLGIHIDLVP